MHDGTAGLVLRAMTLRGVGSYLYGARLEIRPLTILCGKNGSGKSTWFKVLNILRASRAVLPFAFSRYSAPFAWHDYTNAYVRTVADAADHLRDPQADADFGPLGTIGLHFEATGRVSLHGSTRRAARRHDGGSPPQAFLWGGTCLPGTRFRLRLAHPTRLEDDRPLDDLIELRLGDSHLIRMQRRGDGTRYALTCSRAFLPHQPADDSAVVLLAEIEPVDDGRKFKVRALEDGPDPALARAVGRAAVTRIRRLVEVLLTGYFYIGAIRQVHTYGDLQDLDDEHETLTGLQDLAKRRYVGPQGEATHVLERTLAYNLMRQGRPPYSGHLPQEFDERQMTGWRIWSQIEQAIRGSSPSPLRRIWELAPPELQSEIHEFVQRDASDTERESYENGITLLMVKLLNHLLPRRDFYGPGPWPRLNDEAQYLLNRGVDQLGPDEVQRLNRLLLEALFAGPDGILVSRNSFFLETFVSFWLNRLVDAHLKLAAIGRPLGAEWTEPADPPHGFLVHSGPRPQSLFPRWAVSVARKELGVALEDDRDSLARFSHPCFGHTTIPVSPRRFSAGFHQVAPVVVQAGVLQRGEIMAVENPEVHLHPSLQLDLTELLIGEAKLGKVILVETHSDLVVRRVLRAVLQEAIAQEAVRVYFADLRQQQHGDDPSFTYSTLQPLQVNHKGQISNWPDGFMDDDVKESRRLLDLLYGDGPIGTASEEDEEP